jgi:hypothetical protein
MVATTAAVMTIVPNLGMDDVYLAYLPLAHVFELAAEVIYFAIHTLLPSQKECNSGYVPGHRGTYPELYSFWDGGITCILKELLQYLMT